MAVNRHLPKQFRHFTKRTTQRELLLRPDRAGEVANIVGYSLAVASLRHGVEIHAAVAMSNHLHHLGFDSTGNCSDYLRDGHSNISMPMNDRLQRREHFFKRGRGGNTLLLDSEEVMEQMLYIWTNPVAAGLVLAAREWRHFIILPDDWGKPMTFTRPDFFTDPDLPEEVTIIPMPPDIFGDMELEEIRAYCNARLVRRQMEIRIERKRAHKRKVLGMKACFEMSPFSTPRKSEPFSKLNPRFAGKNKHQVALAIAMHKAFEIEHDACWRELKKGRKIPTFPSGCVRYRAFADKPNRGDPHVPVYSPLNM